MKDKIYNIFINSNLKILSIDKINEYIDFCIDKDLKSPIKRKSAKHHILPNKLFHEYANLIENNWNSSHLLHSDHYYAHYLLTEAIDNYSSLYSFCAMHYKDFKLKRINEEDLINEDLIQLKMEERSNKHRIYAKTVGEDGLTNAQRNSRKIIRSNEYLLKLSDRMKGKNNIVHNEGVLNKILHTKLTTIINNKNINQYSSEKAAQTMRENGIYKISAEKHKETLNKLIFFEDKMITLNEKYAIERSRVRTISGRKFVIRDIYNKEMKIYTYAKIVRQISGNLPNTSIDKYLGESKSASTSLIKDNSHLIGLYVEEVSEDQNNKTFITDYELIIEKIKNKQFIYQPELYVVKSVLDDSYYKILTLNETTKISQSLCKRNKDCFLHKRLFDKPNRGLYIEKIIPYSLLDRRFNSSY